MIQADEEACRHVRARAEKAEKVAHALRHALLQVPHGTGDHTDLCRMHNEGLPPMQDEHCHCHVGKVRAAIQAWSL